VVRAAEGHELRVGHVVPPGRPGHPRELLLTATQESDIGQAEALLTDPYGPTATPVVTVELTNAPPTAGSDSKDGTPGTPCPAL